MKPLFIPLKTEYYEAFESGQKTVEYRRAGGPWNERTCAIGRQVTLSKGYGKQNRLSGLVASFEVKPSTSLPARVRSSVALLYGPGKIDIACIGVDLAENNPTEERN